MGPGRLARGRPAQWLDYNAMDGVDGRSATYDAIERRFQKFRKAADERRCEAAKNGAQLSPPGGGGRPRAPLTRGCPVNGLRAWAVCLQGRHIARRQDADLIEACAWLLSGSCVTICRLTLPSTHEVLCEVPRSSISNN